MQNSVGENMIKGADAHRCRQKVQLWKAYNKKIPNR